MPRRRGQIKRVHIDGQEWTYQVGVSTVSIRDPQGKRVHVNRRQVVLGHPHNAQYGYDPDAWGSSTPFTYPTPGIVKNYIWRKLRPGCLVKEPRDLDQAKEIILNYFVGDEVRFAGAS